MKALICVDLQNDFCEGGSLPITGGLAVAAKIGQWMFPMRRRRDTGRGDYDLIVATKDFHIEPGPHFTNWPVHCVPGTWGVEFQPDLFPHGTPGDYLDAIFYKGMYGDGYSGFQGVMNPRSDDAHLSTSLRQHLRNHGIQEVDVVGLALDFCVRATALDAKALGYEVRVLEDMTAAVGDPHKTVGELRKAGVSVGVFDLR